MLPGFRPTYLLLWDCSANHCATWIFMTFLFNMLNPSLSIDVSCCYDIVHWRIESHLPQFEKKQAEETVIYSFLLDLHVFVWKKCFVCYSMYTIFQDVNTSSYFQIMYSISWEWMHFRLIELKLTDIIFLRSPPFRTFLGKMIYSLLVVPKSSAIKTTSTWMKVVSVVMRLAPISRVLYVVHLKLLCSHLKNMWTLYLIVILNMMMMMMMIKWFSNEEKNYIFVKCALNEWKKERN